MKKLLIITLLVFTTTISLSQNRIGIFAGINGSTISDGILKSTGMHSNSFSFHIGGLYEIKLTEKIAFRPKIIFSQQGDREDFDDNMKYEFSYLNFPLNFKFFNKTYILAGPQFGILLNTKKNGFDYGEIDSLDYGVNLGIGRNINDFFVEFNMYQGLKTLIEITTLDGTNLSATNTIIQLSLGYNF